MSLDKRKLESSEPELPSKKHKQDSLLCPILKVPMTRAVFAADGHTYQESAIAQWLSNHNTSPITNNPLHTKQLVPAWAIRSMAQEILDNPLDNPEIVVVPDMDAKTRGYNAFEEKNYEEATLCFTQALQDTDDKDPVRLHLAICLFRTEKFQEAILEIEKLDAQPRVACNYHLMCCYLILCYLWLGDTNSTNKLLARLLTCEVDQKLLHAVQFVCACKRNDHRSARRFVELGSGTAARAISNSEQLTKHEQQLRLWYTNQLLDCTLFGNVAVVCAMMLYAVLMTIPIGIIVIIILGVCIMHIGNEFSLHSITLLGLLIKCCCAIWYFGLSNLLFWGSVIGIAVNISLFYTLVPHPGIREPVLTITPRDVAL